MLFLFICLTRYCEEDTHNKLANPSDSLNPTEAKRGKFKMTLLHASKSSDSLMRKIFCVNDAKKSFVHML